ncbi:MAG TPA: hypothetical protein VGG03_01645 [Thermoanaerobaculia bacterium]
MLSQEGLAAERLGSRPFLAAAASSSIAATIPTTCSRYASGDGCSQQG